jgi:hypothetical protein
VHRAEPGLERFQQRACSKDASRASPVMGTRLTPWGVDVCAGPARAVS